MSNFLHKVIIAAFLIGVASLYSFSSHQQSINQISDQLLHDGLQVTSIFAGAVLMEWDQMDGQVAYSVSVRDLTTLQELTSFQTWNTSATVSNLPTGRTLRFSVARGDNVIILEVILN
ncbi:MAG: hypothetical protein EPGJADBJ_03134 [Saprospiraceae bacterium]|nr:hypothetical protein [Saprospiraceae bacterium]